jgi:N-acetylmuramoyl-L-alanine amidase
MSPILLYPAKVLLISGLLYGYYWCCLRNAPFHGYKRCYLLGITVISLLLPLLNFHIPGLSAWGKPSSSSWLLHEITTGHWYEPLTQSDRPGIRREFLNGQTLIYGVYFGVMIVFLAGLVRSLRYIRRISRLYPREQADGIRIYLTAEPGTPFSFLKKIFWDRGLDRNSIQGRQLFRHEIYHVKQRHTVDILYLEILRTICWCNPFFHLILKEIKATHEFLADRYAVSHHDRYEYAELLVWKSIGNHHPSIVSSFFHTHLKRRITMLTQLKNDRPGYLSRIMVLPLLFLLFCAFAIRLKKEDIHGIRPPSKTLTVVIDAGHGGSDPGTISKTGINEKDLTLAIAKKIKQFSGAYNVTVLMTREKDIMPGGGSTKDEGLHYRTQFAEEHKADLFVSVHVNNAPDTARGLQVYLSSADKPLFQKSSMLGSVMIEAMKNLFATHELLHREENIYVLETAKMPAILIECGNMANPEDLSFITSEKNQEAVAKNILQGIVNYETAQ